jgi:hypothetical protein
MKKLLLIVFAVSLVMSAMAQRKITPGLKPVLSPKTYYEVPLDKGTVPDNAVINVPPVTTKSTSDLTMVLIGASINTFGVLYESQTPLWYEDALHTLLFTCRGNQSGTIGVLATGNDINAFTSTDEGNTWNGQTTLTRTGIYHRYPSGVFYNPTGNTDPANAFTVASGPRTDGNGWIANYHSSANATAGDTAVTYIPAYMGETVEEGMTACTNGTFSISGSWYTSDLMSDSLFWHQGVWNSSTNQADWTVTRIEMGDYLMKNTDNTLLGFLGWSNSASSRDGSVGYVLMRGVDKDNTVHPSFAQVLIKTTDGGQTFQHVPFFDLGTLTAIQEHILPTAADPNVYAPIFSLTASSSSNKFEADIIVDALGKPHIFAEVRGAYSINMDSLGYVWVGQDGYPVDNNLFELYQDINDQWHAVWVDSLVTDNLLDENSTWVGGTSGSIGWTHRIQSSLTPDGTKIMVSWTDSDYQTWGTDREDYNPDLKIWGRDMYSYLNTPVKNITAGDPNLWGMAFLHFMSPVSWIENNTVHIPITVEDIMTNNSPDLPVYHYFLPDITLDFSEFILGGPPSPSAIGSSSISNCFPNPFSGTTSLDVTVNKVSPVTITINSVAGQTVSTTSYGTLSSGTHTLKIDGSKLSGGVYFYTVKVGDEQFTNKMIVK